MKMTLLRLEKSHIGVNRGFSKVLSFSFLIMLSAIFSHGCDKNIGPGNSNGIYEVGNIPFSSTSQGVFVAERYAYVANDTFGLRIIDISNPVNPVLLSTTKTRGYAEDVCISGRYAYVADYDSGLQVIDVFYPESPIKIGSYQTLSMAYAIALKESYAYLADGSYGLRVVNISNPVSPIPVALAPSSGVATDLSISGNYAFVTYVASGNQGRDGFQVFNISNPLGPVSVSSYSIDGTAHGISVVADRAFISGSDLLLYDVINPSTPIFLGKNERLDASGIFVVDNLIYTPIGYNSNGTSYGGLSIFSFDDPTRPIQIADYRTIDIAFNNIYVVGGYIYVTGFNTGLSIFEYTP
jgi:hypothetical protein